MAKKKVKRKTANCKNSDGRLTKRFVNWFRSPEKICPRKLSMFIAIVLANSGSKNPLKKLVKSTPLSRM